MRVGALTVLSFMVALGAPAAQAQYTAKEWPEGPSKARFAASCDGCHDINRVRVGYTAEGWLTIVRMMQNVHAAGQPRLDKRPTGGIASFRSSNDWNA